MTETEHTGVWLSSEVLDENEGARGDVVFTVEVPSHEIEPFEWIEEGKPYREFLVPADVLNRLGKITRLSIERDHRVDMLKRVAEERGVPVELLE